MNVPASDEQMLLEISGCVERPQRLTFSDLAAIDPAHQIADVSRLAPSRQGGAVTLTGLLELAGPQTPAAWLGLHSTSDDFHASIPLAAVRQQAFIIYRQDDTPLSASAGGPCRFYIPDHAACHTDEIDECANVKFVDHIELTATRGYDNRPDDDQKHAALHAKE